MTTIRPSDLMTSRNERDASAALRLSLWAGAIFDAAAALAIFFALPLLSRILSIPVPEDLLYVRFVGILLLGLALFYAVGATAPGGDLRLAAAATAFRLAGGAAVGLQVPLAGAPAGFLAFAAADVGFGAWHGLALARARAGIPRGGGAA